MWTPPLGEVLPFTAKLLQRVGRARGAGKIAHLTLCHLLAAGWGGYDIAWEIEIAPSDHLPFPVAFWYEPECFVLDHSSKFWLAASDPDRLR